MAAVAGGGGGASGLLLVSPPLSRFPITSFSPCCCWSLPSSTTTVTACKSSSSSSSSPPQTLSSYYHNHIHQRRTICGVVYATTSTRQEEEEDEDEEDVESDEIDPQDLEYISQIKRVLELLKKNRDMLFSEVKLTIMIEDPRDVERRRLLGIDEADAPTRDDLAAVLEQVNEGKIPKNRVALQMLAEEMIQWPNLEVEATKKGPRKSLYAKATDTGVDPEVAAKRLNIDWDSAAEIEDADTGDDNEVPSAVGYGALYLVTAFPVIIGISVVLILFFNSLQ